MELGGLAKEANMFILKEAIATASIQCSSEHKKDTLTGQFYGYGFLEYGSKEIPFSFNTKTGEIDLTGNPWDWIAKDLQSKPYTPEEKTFSQSILRKLLLCLKRQTDFTLMALNGLRKTKEDLCLS